MKRYILALDEGTTSARSILFDQNGKIAGIAQKEFPQYYPNDGWVEQDAEEIYAAQYQTILEVVEKSGIHPSQIAAIGITNQRETVVAWNKDNGKPICPAIVWQCRRTASLCDAWKNSGLKPIILEKTGLVVDAYFSGSKIKWIMEQVPGAKELAEQQKLLVGTIDSWLIYRLTNGRIHATDYSNASRTMLFNIHTLNWDAEMMELCGVREEMLPHVQASSSYFGTIALLGEQIPICGVAGDQQAALFGQGCFSHGDTKNTYGTGCFLLMHTGHQPIMTDSGLLTTIAATEEGKEAEYALEGSVFVGGAVIQWLRDELKLIRNTADSETVAKSVPDNGGVYVVPAFNGIGTPYWNMYARGTILGLTRGQSSEHIVRAALESIAYQTNDVLKAMEQATGDTIPCLRADGGATRNRLLMQMQADVSARNVEVGESEATALGAAFLAGLKVGFWKDREELKSLLQTELVCHPQKDDRDREAMLDGWDRAVRAAILFSQK